MTTVAQAIRDAAADLAHTSDTARLDAEVLMAHALGMARSDMLIRAMRDPASPEFERLVERRAKREPVAYITGTQEFYGRRFGVTRDTLIPRPDSETVVEAALEALSDAPVRRAANVLDLGTGTGALLLSILAERPAFHGLGLDRSEGAIATAKRNAAALGLSDRSKLRVGGWHEGADEHGRGWWHGLGEFDLVVANPPYVETGAQLDPDVAAYEPHGALFAGADGLDDYRVIIPGLRHIVPMAVLEIGSSQAEAVSELAEKAGFAVDVRHDLANRPRALILS